MKKNIIRTAALAALLLVGSLSASAQQKSYNVPELNPEYQAMAQLVVDNQLADPDAANKNFTKLLKKIKDDKEALLAVGHFFLENNNYPAAKQCANYIEKADPVYIDGLMFRGEVFMYAKQYGQAGQCFDQVLALDENNVTAMKRNAFVYKNVNPYVAIEQLTKIKQIQPDYYEADKELGDINYNMNKYPEAVKYYDVYYANTPKTAEALDIRSCENYLMSLFSVQKMDQISQIVSEIEPLAPKDLMIRRMKFFASFERARNSINYAADMAKVADNMGYLTSCEYADSIFLFLDYQYAAEYKKEMNDIPAAIEFYKKAVSRDEKKTGALAELAKLYRRNKQYNEAIATFTEYMTKQGDDKIKVADYLQLAQMYIPAARQEGLTPEQKQDYLNKGDEALAKALEKDPTAYQAWLLRAQMSITDPRTAEEKPREYYEKALEVMTANEKGSDANYTQVYSYLAFYHVQKDNYTEARKYTNLLLQRDPEHATGLQIDKYLKSQGK